MDNRSVLTAAFDALSVLVQDFLATLDDVPDEDLANWKPSAEQNDGGEMNTLSAISAHAASAASWMIVHQVFGQDFPRDRESEFDVIATREQIDRFFAGMLANFAALIETTDELDLLELPPTVRESQPEWTRLHWLFHAIDHTALHLGHAQIHRQLWQAERADKS